MSLLRTILPLFVVATAFAAAGRRQDPPSPTLESLRARWERFTPEQKVRARARYEQYLAMTEEERQQLAASARALKERGERVQSELEASAPERVASLEPEKRREIVREIVVEESREIGARIRTRVPEPWVERIRKARPEDRLRFLRQFQIQQRDRVARYAIGELGKRLELPEEEIRRMQALPGPERGQAVLELRQRLSARDVHEHGLPPGITPEQWEAWLALPPDEFFEAFQRYRLSRIESMHLRELLEAARPRPEEALALAHLSPEERAARLAQSKRERCTRVIRERELLSADEQALLASKSHKEFFEEVRRLLRPGR